MILKLLNAPRSAKRLAFLVVDTALVPIALYAAFALRLGKVDPLQHIGSSWVLFPIMIVLGAILINSSGLPRIKLNAFEFRAMVKVGATAVLLSLVAMITSYIFALTAPRSVPIIFGTIFFLLSVMGRIFGLYVLRHLVERSHERTPVVIYGAGASGIQMASALRQSTEARPVAFVDDNSNLQGLMVAGLPVYEPKNIARTIRRTNAKRVLIAMPSVDRHRRGQIIESLKDFDVEVQVLPSYVELMNGESGVDELRPVLPDQLLDRDMVELETPEIAKSYAGRVVMVTGAGGSIGSELCRQLLNCRPAEIILFERSEFQLYSIDKELMDLAEDVNVRIKPILGSVIDPVRVRSVIAENSVDIILHTAAYKHVPLVEDNELEGARNNVIGTQVVAEAAKAAGIERMILVSTDKAVRPTNVMGATKRMAELVVQDIQTRSTTTKFAMVRFGNVLGSSGSVIPLFRDQIAKGGPVTVTHPEVTRYFMTIPEAARLVLLAGAYATGGDVFVLDMGKEQKILDLAKRMITLSGRTVKDPDTGTGEIEIAFTGLRPGEKLYEELLIDNDSLVGTPHAKILRAEEIGLSQIEAASMLKSISNCIDEGDENKLRTTIQTYVNGYKQVEPQLLKA